MIKHTFTVFGNNDDIRTIEKGLFRYFRKAFNATIKHENSNKKSLTVSVIMWRIDKVEFEQILSKACIASLKGTSLNYRESWYIDVD